MVSIRFMESLPDFLRRLRARKDWSQEQAAHAADISVGAYCKLEQDVTKEPKKKTVAGLSRAFDVPASQFYKRIGESDGSASPRQRQGRPPKKKPS